MNRTITDGIHKIEIVEHETYCEITYYELMGERYVQLGATERWSKELVEEEF